MPDYLQTSDDATVITLSRPITVTGAKVSTLTMRSPTVADQLTAEKLGKDSGETDCAYLANLCMITPDEFKTLTLRDYGRVKQAFLGFIE